MPRFFRLSFFLALCVLASCHVGRYFIYNFADIRDYKKFPSRPVEKGDAAFRFYTAQVPRAPKELTMGNKQVAFDDYLEKNKTVAFLIIKDDSIHYEQYWSGRDETSVIPSFSMAKSVTSMLIGCAIEDGYISSVNDSVTKYLPELSANGFGKVTLLHLLQMTSGLNYKEQYGNPFGHVAKFYYGKNLYKHSFQLTLKEAPGTEFDYVSGNTQLLGLVLDRALKGKKVSQYLTEKIWQPLGMEFDATWSIDREDGGVEKAFCCLNARARDFAKLGRLYLNKGNWNGRQIVPRSWVEASTKVDTTAGSAWFYQYQWWIPSYDGAFMAEGILGQFVYVHPQKNLIIVRLGKREANVGWWSFFAELAKAY